MTLLLLLAGVRVWDPFPVEVVRLKIFDLYQQAQPRVPGVRPVAIVDIDEESLSQIGQWPWPRTIVAKLVQQLLAMGAVGIGFDVVFPEPDRMSPAHYADSLPEASAALRRELGLLPSNDEVFARVLEVSPVVLGQSGYFREVDRDQGPPREIPVMRLGPTPDHHFPRFTHLVRNIKTLEDAARGVAFFNLLPERDGIVRRVPLVIAVEGVVIPALPLELLRVLAGPQTPLLIRSDEAGISGIGAAGIEIPTDRSGQIWVNFAKDDAGLYLSAADVLEGRVGPERVKGRIVLIGTSAAGLFDIKATPLDRQLPGVAVHAQILETILTRSFLVRPHYALGAEVALLVMVGAFVIVIVPIFGAVAALLTGAGLAGGLVAFSWFLYSRSGLLIDVTYPSLGALAAFSVLVFANYFREEAQKRQVRSAFGQYLSPELVDQLAKDTSQLRLGGESKDMTLVFCDVRDFTTISEDYRDDPVGLTSLTNRLLTPLSDAILDQHGTIDKYMGDAVMAFWNAPLNDPEHALHACKAALAMRGALQDLNEVMAEEAGREPQDVQGLRIGIGINSGTCVVGNLGTDKRFDYSVLGDSVNLASRLEGLSKTYGVDIVIGETTARQVEETMALLELDLVQVKGKQQAVRIFALIGEQDVKHEHGYERLSEMVGRFLAAYRSQDWAQASALLDDMAGPAKRYGLMPLVELYDRRIESMMANPPGPDWSGVFSATSK